MKLTHPGKDKGKKIVVIVGGGFAGLNAAKTLADESEVEVVLIDQRNHHLFQPLLYQVATAGLNPSDIAVPIRAQFSDNENVEVHLGKIEKVQLKERTIANRAHSQLEESIFLEYDYLILACGARHSYFGNNAWQEFAPGLKTLEQATEIRKRILSIYERAENEVNPEIRSTLLNFVVVGGGPTGVELAGAIADISRTVLLNDFKNIDPAQTRVILVEAGPRVLAQFSEDLSKKAKEDLEDLGVEVRTSTRVEKITADGVYIPNEFIKSNCVLWAAGVQAAPINFDEDVERDRAGRIKVNPDLSLPNHPEVFVVGDLASIQMGENQFVPGLAPAAIQGGAYAGKKILSLIRGQKIDNFKYFDKGQMATIGRNRALMQAGRLKMTGFMAWMAWFFIHILYLVGFKNRVAVMTQWAWSYLFSKRGARLITESEWRLKD
ncbi:NAD(P)/FAD-dependent oxidoreductase [Pseudobdellovibrio sp. HCB154]|uniref:NAD(P)/FAD-dependent oxidoreductase n=1 Tax=Pseudobdellovibrio sp. HCB154 TaxID=3386277 RepID=UPI003916EE15